MEFFLDKPWNFFWIDHEVFSSLTMIFSGSTMEFFLNQPWIFSGFTIEYFIDRPWNLLCISYGIVLKQL